MIKVCKSKTKPQIGDVKKKKKFAFIPIRVDCNGVKIWLWWEYYWQIYTYLQLGFCNANWEKTSIIIDEKRLKEVGLDSTGTENELGEE